MHRSAAEGHRVLVSAPYGSDAASVAQLLGGRGYDVRICPTVDTIAGHLDETVGAIVVTEEALSQNLAGLDRALASQPRWSDVPFVLLAGRQAGREMQPEAIRRRLPESAINVVLLERPVSSESLISAVASAMRARQKQFEIRDRIAELNGQQARLTALLEHLPVGVAFVDTAGDTHLSNQAYRKFRPDGEVPMFIDGADRSWSVYDANGERIHEDTSVSMRALRGETVTDVEYLFHAPQGADLWTRVSGVPLFDGDGKVTGAISVVVDIDEQKRSQLALTEAAQLLESQVAERTAALREAMSQLKEEADERQRAEAALRQSQKMEAVGQLTGGIAHDFNNMLTGVIGALDIIKRRIASNRLDDLDRFMDAALASSQRAAGLTARLLAFSRRQSLDSRPTDIAALVASLEDLLRRTMSERIDVSIVTGGAVPAGVVDANQLENAILNLAINARDAMPDGGRLTIETNVVELDAAYVAKRPGIEVGQYVVIAVSDTGVGMDSATLEKVFEPFYTTKPIGQGTGLGLSMVYGFAKQSNGHVAIHSTPGLGTSVKIYLPVAEMPAGDEHEVRSAVQEGHGQSVLLVEDDPSVRLLIGEVLQELGYVVVEAAEPESAIRTLQSGKHFDLMISDVGLPGMNGRQLAEIAREHLASLPILFVTGYAENATQRAGFLGPNMDMIAKPFQIEVLSAKVSEMLAAS